MMNREAIMLMAAADVEDPHAMVQLIVERGMLRAREPVIDRVGAGWSIEPPHQPRKAMRPQCFGSRMSERTKALISRSIAIALTMDKPRPAARAAKFFRSAP
ncbi:hypothetical protein [Paraburkholderia sp. UCT2]|uniref:hypothetical protein n=1 Tax=Paraburkholderia sp. UCT2 TaxID=2615208 RepID=UPI00292A555C|nr:hypothetical protein [Paraburkholderia sp. UCT2]